MRENRNFHVFATWLDAIAFVTKSSPLAKDEVELQSLGTQDGCWMFEAPQILEKFEQVPK